MIPSENAHLYRPDLADLAATRPVPDEAVTFAWLAIVLWVAGSTAALLDGPAVISMVLLVGSLAVAGYTGFLVLKATGRKEVNHG